MRYGAGMRSRRALTVVALIGLAAGACLEILGIIGMPDAHANPWLIGLGIGLLTASIWLGLRLHGAHIFLSLLQRQPKEEEDEEPQS